MFSASFARDVVEGGAGGQGEGTSRAHARMSTTAYAHSTQTLYDSFNTMSPTTFYEQLILFPLGNAI